MLAGPGVGTCPQCPSSLVGPGRRRLRVKDLLCADRPAGDGGRTGRRRQDPAGHRGGPGLAPPGGCGWCDSTPSTPPHQSPEVAETLHLPEASACWSNASPAPRPFSCSTTANTSSTGGGPDHRAAGCTAGLRVLATSQTPLDLDGETATSSAPLTIEDSVTLFAGRSRRTAGGSCWTTRPPLCRGGLPLARRPAAGDQLAAARVRSLSVQDIARRLDDRFALLQDPTADAPSGAGARGGDRLELQLLFPDDQRGLWALSCFAGGAPLDAAEHVLAALGVPRSSAVDVVGRLADRSLVSVETPRRRGAVPVAR